MHRRLLGAIAIAAVIAAACGSSSSPSPSGGTNPSTNPGTSSAPTQAPTQAPTITEGPLPTQSNGATSFGAAADALDALDSYKFNVKTNLLGVADADNGLTTMSGTVVKNNGGAGVAARTFDLVQTDESGATTSETHYVGIGDKVWFADGADALAEIPAAQAALMQQVFLGFQPEKIFSLYFGGYATGFQSQGDESRNGVNCTHFKGDASLNAIFSQLAGVVGEWESDVWLAKDGGYLVGSTVKATGASASGAGSLDIDVEITNINDSSNLVPTPPAG